MNRPVYAKAYASSQQSVDSQEIANAEARIGSKFNSFKKSEKIELCNWQEFAKT